MCLLFSWAAQAQVTQTARFELQAPGDDSSYKILPWAENGVMIYRRVELAGPEDILYFIKLDSGLRTDWGNSISVS